MSVEEIFQSKTGKSHIAKEWKEVERGKDPLIQQWMKRKRQQSFRNFEKHKSTS